MCRDINEYSVSDKINNLDLKAIDIKQRRFAYYNRS